MMTRRQAIVLPAALAASTALPARAEGYGVVDLLVIGGGGAGMAAALAAAQGGARVVLVERSDTLGGTLELAGGQMAGAGTVLQRSHGIVDTAEEHFEDILRITRGTVDPALARLWAAHGGATIDWIQSIGVEFRSDHPWVGNHEPYRIARAVAPVGRGPAVAAAMRPLIERAVADGKIRLLLRSRVVELIQDRGGAVTGAVVEGPDGTLRDIAAGATLIASGGCTANPRLFQDFHGVPLYYQGGHQFADGSGVLLGLGAGGHVRGGEHYCPLTGAIMADATTPGTRIGVVAHGEAWRPAHILVNAEGDRFVDEREASPYAQEQALRRQTGHRAWLIHDMAALAAAPPIPGWDADRYRASFAGVPPFVAAPTIAQLALRAAIHPAGLAASVAAFNQETGDAAIAQPPFHAVQIQGFTVFSFAGLAVDPELRVVRQDGRPISGLYAAGEVIGGGATSGDTYCNGAMITPALAFGRLVGMRVAAAAMR